MNFLSRIFGRKPPQNLGGKSLVSFDEHGVTRNMPDGRVEAVSWHELQEVMIVTTGAGPFEDDVFWVLSGNGRGCAVPSESAGMKELLTRLQQLPGFNNESVIQAMGSTSNAKFICWSRGNAL